MYALIRQAHPPTGVEHCLSCKFVSADEDSLIVAGPSFLSVYRLKTSDIDVKSQRSADLPTEKKKLELVIEHQLYGNLQSIQSVRLHHDTKDSLLLGFSDAKLSIVQFDVESHDIKTAGLHYFEEDIYQDGSHNISIPLVRVDPEGRCASMLVYGSRLAIIPFGRDHVFEEHEAFTPADGQKSDGSFYMIELHKLDGQLNNVIDIQFLHGYYEPTLLILYEPIQTWPGRVAARQDTCALVAISLNLVDQVHPVIWTLGHLPFDCLQAMPVPKPIGGVVVLATNSMLYLNQSVPPYGVSLNSITGTSTGFSLKPQPGVCISLDCARAAFVSNDHLMLSLKGGEIYVVTLIADSMRSVRSFNFDKAARSVITTAICVTGDGYLFLGSRLGNSILLRYTEKADHCEPVVGEDEEETQPEAKKSRLDSISDEPSPPVLDDMDELEVYGTEAQSGTELASYTFEVCDSIVNIAPVARMVLGEPSFLSFASVDQLDLELVTCSGFGKNGALSVLQRSIRPQVVTTFELSGCTDMWTVRSSKQPEDKEDEEEERDESMIAVYHSYLILSRGDSSIVLHTAQDINELDHSGFYTKAPTVFAGNVADNKYIIQVCPKNIHLLEGDTLLESLAVDDYIIVGCSLADPYAVLLCSDGSLSLVTVQDTLTDDSDSKASRLHMRNHALSSGSHIIACSAYKDVSGLFGTGEERQTVEVKFEAPVVVPMASTPVQPSFGSISHLSVEEEDDLLYGDLSDRPFTSTAEQSSTQQSAERHSSIQQVKPVAPIKPTFWCAVCRENGNLEIYTLPGFQLAMQVLDFPAGLQLLTDKTQGEQDGEALQMGILPVHEVLLTGMGPKCDQPYLIAHVDQDLLVYKAFKSPTRVVTDHLKIRFKKVEHQLLLREKTSRTAVRLTDQDSSASGLDREQLTKTRVSSLRVFHNVAGYSGVFVCGHYPHWLFVTERGVLRAHPMSIDGSITSFASFNNVNCAEGFLYLNKSEELRICVLPTNMLYDTHWPVKQVPLRATPHSLSFHPESKTYAVVASQPVVNKAAPRLNNDDLEEIETVEREERFIYPTLDRFSLQLFSPVNWELIPNTKFDLHDWERLTALKTVRLRSEQTISRRKSFIAMATTYAFGEEVSAHGRILLFDVVDVVPEPGKPLTRHKLKLLCKKDQRGPVTTLEQVDGLLLTAVGQKVYVWDFKGGKDLIGIAFIDTQLYIHTAVSLKNFVLVTDIMKSVSLLRYQEEHKSISLISRDVYPLEVFTAEYVVDNKQIGFLVTDSDKNLILYQYHPEALESNGGQRLLRRADFNLGSLVNTMFRTPCKTSGAAVSLASSSDKRHITWFGTLDGAIGFLIPTSEKTYRRLLMLQNKMIVNLPHVAGLNPKSFRMFRSRHCGLNNPHRNILDGDLLWRYVSLGHKERVELARQIGTTQGQILQDLTDVEKASSVF